MKTVMRSFRFFLPVSILKREELALSNKILLMLLICLLTLIGCLLPSQGPVGETPASINPQEWEGTWVSNDSDVGTRILQNFNPSQGIFIMKTETLNPQNKQKETETSWLYLRQSGDWIFASWREVGDSTFTWGGRVENLAREDKGRVLILWLPDGREIVRLIKRGELPGRLVGEKGKESPILGPLSPRHYQVMRDNEKRIFYAKENKPIVLVRLAKQ